MQLDGWTVFSTFCCKTRVSSELVGQTASFNATRVLLGHASPTMFYISPSSCLDCEFLNCFFQGSYLTIIGAGVQSVPRAYVDNCWNPFLCLSHLHLKIKVRTPLPFLSLKAGVGLVVDFPRGGHTLMSGTTSQLSQPYPGGGVVCGGRVH